MKSCCKDDINLIAAFEAYCLDSSCCLNLSKIKEKKSVWLVLEMTFIIIQIYYKAGHLDNTNLSMSVSLLFMNCE